MPNWKKVITSGSAASLSSLNVANAITASGFSGDGSNITNIGVAELATVSDSFTNVTNVTSTHNFGTKDVMVSVYNSSDEMIIPGTITTNLNTVVATFDIATTGRVVVAKGGHLVSGSVNSFGGQAPEFYAASASTHADRVAKISVLSASAHTQREAVKGLATTANNSLSSSIATELNNATGSVSLNTRDSSTFAFWQGSQAQYDALGSYDSNVIYLTT